MCPILGPLVPLFWISSDISSGFQSQSGLPYSHCGGEHNVCSLRSTSGATHADLLAAGLLPVLPPHTIMMHLIGYKISTNYEMLKCFLILKKPRIRPNLLYRAVYLTKSKYICISTSNWTITSIINAVRSMFITYQSKEFHRMFVKQTNFAIIASFF